MEGQGKAGRWGDDERRDWFARASCMWRGKGLEKGLNHATSCSAQGQGCVARLQRVCCCSEATHMWLCTADCAADRQSTAA